MLSKVLKKIRKFNDKSIQGFAFESDFVDDNVEGITKLTDDVVITCTVTYNDGTSESKEIGLKGIKETIKDDGEQPCEVADFACELK